MTIAASTEREHGFQKRGGVPIRATRRSQEVGGNMDIKDKDGNTATALAAQWNAKGVVRVLLDSQGEQPASQGSPVVSQTSAKVTGQQLELHEQTRTGQRLKRTANDRPDCGDTFKRQDDRSFPGVQLADIHGLERRPVPDYILLQAPFPSGTPKDCTLVGVAAHRPVFRIDRFRPGENGDKAESTDQPDVELNAASTCEKVTAAPRSPQSATPEKMDDSSREEWIVLGDDSPSRHQQYRNRNKMTVRDDPFIDVGFPNLGVPTPAITFSSGSVRRKLVPKVLELLPKGADSQDIPYGHTSFVASAHTTVSKHQDKTSNARSDSTPFHYGSNRKSDYRVEVADVYDGVDPTTAQQALARRTGIRFPGNTNQLHDQVPEIQTSSPPKACTPAKPADRRSGSESDRGTPIISTDSPRVSELIQNPESPGAHASFAIL